MSIGLEHALSLRNSPELRVECRTLASDFRLLTIGILGLTNGVLGFNIYHYGKS